MKKDITTTIDNVEAKEKIEGSAKYTSDIHIEGAYYAKTIRSSLAKGLIKSIKIPSLPKDYFVVDESDIPGENVVAMIDDDWPVFAANRVEYIGQPIMLIVGPDKAKVHSLCQNVKITYAEETPTLDFGQPEKTLKFHKGDIKKAFKEADEIIEYDYETNYQEQAYIEPQGFIGYPENNGVHLIGSIQCPYYVKNAVKRTMAFDDDQVRIKQAFVGGAFGGKEEFPSLMACQLAVAIDKIQQPIKMIYEREEDMVVTTKRHPAKIKMQAAVNRDHKVTAIKSEVALDGGAHIGLSEVVLSRSMLAVSNAYTIDNLDVKGHVYKTNTVPNGAFRGFGAPQMIFAIEMFIHHIAKKRGLDPYQFRMKHLVKQGDKTATSGIYRDPIIMRDMIKKATEMSDYHEKVKRYNQKGSFKGIGMSWFLHGCGFTGSGEKDIIKAKVRLKKDSDDQVYILVAAVDMGQGAKTTLRKVVAQVLDIDIEHVIFDNPDTLYVPDSGPTVASRTMMIVGGLLARAAQKLKNQWLKSQEQTVEEIYEQPSYVKWDQKTMHGDAYPAYSWGVNVVEVEIDKVTYEVNVKQMWSVYDLGKAIDENIVLGQADGGQAQGIGYGMLEVMQHKDGRIQQRNMTDYIIPTAADMAKTKNIIMDNPYPLGPYGAKGVGELTLVGGAPAVALAIEMAINRPLRKIPVTPEVIMEAITDA